MAAPARVAAYEALRAIHKGQHDLPAALAQTRRALRDDRDRGLTADIVTGTLRWQGALDFLVRTLANRPLERLDPEVLDILRLSAYQILHLDRVPASAAVDDGVSLARYAGRTSATGFVNGVLRSLTRTRNRLPWPDAPGDGAAIDDQARHLAIVGSHPEWLVRRWIAAHGFERTETWCRFNNAPAPLTIRANRLRITPEDLGARLAERDIQTSPARFAPDGLVVTAGNPITSDLAHEGLFVVQDEASQLVPLVVGARAGETILDYCAAPGGKTIALAVAMENRGTLVATDVRERRMRLLRDTVRPAGAHAALVQIDGRHDPPFQRVFDRVLVDAPCSGLGTVRRDPDIKWRRREADLAAMADAQLRLLTRAAALLKPGGVVIYSTCSSEPEENEAVVSAFLAEHPDVEPLDVRALLPRDSPVVGLVDEAGHLRTWPWRDALEAFFAAALRLRAARSVLPE